MFGDTFYVALEMHFKDGSNLKYETKRINHTVILNLYKTNALFRQLIRVCPCIQSEIEQISLGSGKSNSE